MARELGQITVVEAARARGACGAEGSAATLALRGAGGRLPRDARGAERVRHSSCQLQGLRADFLDAEEVVRERGRARDQRLREVGDDTPEPPWPPAHDAFLAAQETEAVD